MLPALVQRYPQSDTAHPGGDDHGKEAHEAASEIGRHVRTVLRSVIVDRAVAWSAMLASDASKTESHN